MRNKKASGYRIIKQAAAIITIIIALMLVYSVSNSVADSSSSLACTKILESFSTLYTSSVVDREDTGLFSGNSIKQIKNLCTRDSAEIKDNIIPAVDLVENCWNRGGRGVNVLKNERPGTSFCMYCGEIESSKDIDDFSLEFTNYVEEKESLKKSLLEDSTSNNRVRNVNKNTLSQSSLPQGLNEEEKIDVFYFVNKPIECDFFNDNIINRDEFCVDETQPSDTYAGVYLTKSFNGDTTSTSEKSKLEISVQENSKFQCEPIFPLTKEEQEELVKENN